MELIDKSALVAEIEKRLKKYKEEIEKYSPFQHNLVYDIIGKKEECSDILSFLDTLEVKEVDLEKELDSLIIPELKKYKALPSLMDVAKHFFELGLKAQKGEKV